MLILLIILIRFKNFYCLFYISIVESIYNSKFYQFKNTIIILKVRKVFYNGFSEESLRKIAQQKVNFRYSVRIHLSVYLIVSTLLLIINLVSSPLHLWIIYPFFGWLIGVSIHTLSYILYARGVFPMAKRSVIFHLDAYLFTILLLILINVFTLPEILWVLYPIIFWGIALIFHIVTYLLYYQRKIDEHGKLYSKRTRAIEKELEKMKKRLKS